MEYFLKNWGNTLSCMLSIYRGVYCGLESGSIRRSRSESLRLIGVAGGTIPRASAGGEVPPSQYGSSFG
jgi:hypothetical protein